MKHFKFLIITVLILSGCGQAPLPKDPVPLGPNTWCICNDHGTFVQIGDANCVVSSATNTCGCVLHEGTPQEENAVCMLADLPATVPTPIGQSS